MGKRKENTTNCDNQRINYSTCVLTYAIDLIGGRWKLLILCKLEHGKQRFGELKKEIPNITERMLSLQLRELEKAGLISRQVFAEVPPRVEYELTESSKELIPIWQDLSKWGAKHKQLVEGDEEIFAQQVG